MSLIQNEEIKVKVQELSDKKFAQVVTAYELSGDVGDVFVKLFLRMTYLNYTKIQNHSDYEKHYELIKGFELDKDFVGYVVYINDVDASIPVFVMGTSGTRKFLRFIEGENNFCADILIILSMGAKLKYDFENEQDLDDIDIEVDIDIFEIALNDIEYKANERIIKNKFIDMF